MTGKPPIMAPGLMPIYEAKRIYNDVEDALCRLRAGFDKMREVEKAARALSDLHEAKRPDVDPSRDHLWIALREALEQV